MAKKTAPKPKSALGNKSGSAKKANGTKRPAMPSMNKIPDRSKQVQSFLKKYSAGAQ